MAGIATERAAAIQKILDAEGIDHKVAASEVATDPKGRVEPKDNVAWEHNASTKEIVITISYDPAKVATKVSSTGKCLLVGCQTVKGTEMGPLAPDFNVLCKYPLS